MINLQWRNLRHGLAVLSLVVLLMFLVSSPAIKNHIDQAAAWTIQFAQSHPLRGAIIFVLYSAISALMAFASSAVLVPTAVAVYGKWGAFFLLWIGWIMGSSIAYAIGRMMTPLLIRMGYGKKLVKYQQFISREMKFWSVLIFCVVIPSEVPGYLFGGAHYRFWKFMAAMAIAESLYAFGLIQIGKHLLTIKPSLGVLAIALLIVIVTTTRILRKNK